MNLSNTNAEIKQTLTHLIESGRLPHCILLEGQAAIDKVQFAREIAAALVCKNTGCGTCKDCIQILKGTHQDVRLIEKDPDKTEFTVDKVRFVSGDMNISPGSAHCKMYILKDAHLLNTQAQNALLKSLEEPPNNVFFILTCTSQTLLLETIRSRGMTFTLQEEAKGKAQKQLLEQTEDRAYIQALTENLPTLQVWLLQDDRQKLNLIEQLILGALNRRRDIVLVQLRQLFSLKDKEEIKQLLLLTQNAIKLCLEYKALGNCGFLGATLQQESNRVSREKLLNLFDRLEDLVDVLPIHLNNSVAEVHFAAHVIDI